MNDNKNGGHWFDSLYKESEKKGDFDFLPGKGKPLSRESVRGDALGGMLKNANYKPPWLQLQHEIRDRIGKLVTSENIQQAQLDEVNKKIKKYNLSCPPPMQKSLISSGNIKRQYDMWK